MAIELKLLVVSFMLAAALLQVSEAVTHVVLDSTGWVVPSSGSSAEYVTWAAAQTFAVGDSLIFNYATGAHDVAEVSKTAYEGCTKTTTITLTTTGPTNITLLTAGEHYYICTVGDHCSQGQKLAINVTTTSTAPPPGTTTASPPPPGTTTASPPPPPSAATPLATAALPMITLFSIVLAMLH